MGEDQLLLPLLEELRGRAQNVYVDVGAHDPIVFSNTLLLHKAGWRGINIDASEESIRRFRAHRPVDHNVLAAVSDVFREVVYYRYPSPACNRILAHDSPDTVNILGERPVSSTPVTTRPLNDVLAAYVRPGERIGFLNIDCEGEDFRILRSLDWVRWRPYLVAVESHSPEMTEEMCCLMDKLGYGIVGQFPFTLLFRNSNLPKRRRRGALTPARETAADSADELPQPLELGREK
jgi:FkbM family methyltransferase